MICDIALQLVICILTTADSYFKLSSIRFRFSIFITELLINFSFGKKNVKRNSLVRFWRKPSWGGEDGTRGGTEWFAKFRPTSTLTIHTHFITDHPQKVRERGREGGRESENGNCLETKNKKKVEKILTDFYFTSS